MLILAQEENPTPTYDFMMGELDNPVLDMVSPVSPTEDVIIAPTDDLSTTIINNSIGVIERLQSSNAETIKTVVLYLTILGGSIAIAVSFAIAVINGKALEAVKLVATSGTVIGIGERLYDEAPDNSKKAVQLFEAVVERVRKRLESENPDADEAQIAKMFEAYLEEIMDKVPFDSKPQDSAEVR